MWSARSHIEAHPNARTLALLRARASGEPLWDLCESNPTRAQIAYDEPEIIAALSDRAVLRYEPEPFGMASARAAVAVLCSTPSRAVAPSSVMLTASTSEAYSFLFKLLCDPGDEVLVPRPSYPLFEQLARLEGVALRGYALLYDGAWHIDLDSVRAARTGRTRALLVVSPNNPTGSFLKRAELGALAEFGLPIVCDEVFGAYAHQDDPRRVRSVLDGEAELVFALGGLSKYAGLPQLKLAWTAVGGAPAAQRAALERLEHIADTFLSASAPVQVALPEILRRSRRTRDSIRARLVHNLSVLRLAVADAPLSLLHLEGGWYATLRLPAVCTEEEWVLGLIEHARVSVEPGYFYDFAGEPYVVVSLLTMPTVFDEGLRRLRDHVIERVA